MKKSVGGGGGWGSFVSETSLCSMTPPSVIPHPPLALRLPPLTLVSGGEDARLVARLLRCYGNWPLALAIMAKLLERRTKRPCVWDPGSGLCCHCCQAWQRSRDSVCVCVSEKVCSTGQCVYGSYATVQHSTDVSVTN